MAKYANAAPNLSYRWEWGGGSRARTTNGMEKRQ